MPTVPAALTGGCSEAAPCFWKTKAALMRLAVSRLRSLPLKEGLKCLNPLLLSACRRRAQQGDIEGHIKSHKAAQLKQRGMKCLPCSTDLVMSGPDWSYC